MAEVEKCMVCQGKPSRPVRCPNIDCNEVCCRACFGAMFKHTTDQPETQLRGQEQLCCRNCNHVLDDVWLYQNMGKAYVTEKYKKLSARHFVYKTLSSQAGVASVNAVKTEIDLVQAELLKAKNVVKGLNNRLRTLKDHLHSESHKLLQEKAIAAANKVICPKAQCKGFLLADDQQTHVLQCNVCSFVCCNDCREPINPKAPITAAHTCNPEERASVQAILRESSACPGCGHVIYKGEGCDDMFCTVCHTTFSYTTGQRRQFEHNPHLQEAEKFGHKPRQNLMQRMRLNDDQELVTDLDVYNVLNINLRTLDNRLYHMRKSTIMTIMLQQTDFLEVIEDLKQLVFAAERLAYFWYDAFKTMEHKIAYSINPKLVDLTIDHANHQITDDMLHRQVAKLQQCKTFYKAVDVQLSKFIKNLNTLVEQLEQRLNRAHDLHIVHTWFYEALGAITHATNNAILPACQIYASDMPFLDVCDIRIGYWCKLSLVRTYLEEHAERMAANRSAFIHCVLPQPLSDHDIQTWTSEWKRTVQHVQALVPGSAMGMPQPAVATATNVMRTNDPMMTMVQESEEEEESMAKRVRTA